MTEVERICLAALDRPAGERAAFLADACHGDDALRLDIESLLAHSSSAEQFIEHPAVAGAGALAGLSGLSLGQRLGPYHIVARLGAGGMGEVYRAHDTQLGREVAIKILPVMYAADPERLARFEREARVLASLNHPHIAAIYGVEATPSEAGPHGRALVMELVEGPTLAERIADGPLRTAEALVIAGQIADALAAAHERGIIHRDLKPANIKVTPDRVVKVLDFGLAKAEASPADVRHPQADLTNSPTFRTGGTKQGVILGTAAYMSPEQSRGEAVDKRTDIWAFGCVLFEMLAGRSVFAAASVTETLSEVLKTEPDWQRLPADTPEGVRRLLRRCLTKDRARRLADIRDAQLDLDEAPADAPHHAGRKSPVVRARWAIAVMAAVIGIAALTWIVSTMRGEEAAQPRSSRLSIPLWGAAAIAGDVAITPDGTVVYVGNKGTQIFVRPLEQLEPRLIATAAAPLNSVFVSPDGQSVGFGEGGRMKKVAISGGPVQLILDTGGSDATWAPDNTIIFVSLLTPGLQRVSAAGGDVTVLTRPDPARGELAHAFPEMLPGGRAVLFTITSMSGGPGAAQVAVLELATGEYKTLVPGGSRAQYVPGGRGSAATRAERDNGHLVYVAGGALLAIPFDLGALETRGTAVPVVPRSASRQDIRDFDVAADGTLVYVDAPEATSSAARNLVFVDRQGGETALGTPPNSYRHPRLSSDDAQVAVAHGDAISVWDVRGQTMHPRTFGRGGDFAPVWTTNDERLIFRRTAGLFWQRADGTGPVDQLGMGIPSGVTPDGKWVLFSLPPGTRDVMRLALDGTKHVEPLIAGPPMERNGVVSADGHWLAYEEGSEGPLQIYVVPYPNVTAGKWPVTTTGGTRPLWSRTRNSLELFYVAPDGALMAVRGEPREGAWRAAGSPTKAVEGPYSTGDSFSPRNYDVSADGQRFLMVKEPVNRGAPSQIIVDQSWHAELTRPRAD